MPGDARSAVYRITGVLTVIAGWFLTALIAFTIAFLVALGLMWGGMIAVVLFACLCAYLLVQSSILHSRKVKKQAEKMAEEEADGPEQTVIERCVHEVSETMLKVTEIYQQTLVGLFDEDRKLLKQMVRESEELYRIAHERKHEMLPTLFKLQENYIETGHYYVQVIDYMNEVTKALVHITRPSFDHINNNHEGMTKEQVADLQQVNEKVSSIYQKINTMLENNGYFSQLDAILQMRDKLFDTLAAAYQEPDQAGQGQNDHHTQQYPLPDHYQRNEDDGAANPEPAQVAALFHVRGVGPAFAGLYLAAVRAGGSKRVKRGWVSYRPLFSCKKHSSGAINRLSVSLIW